MAASFHGEGDYSLIEGVAISGAWMLAYESEEEKKNCLVSLLPGGLFSSMTSEPENVKNKPSSSKLLKDQFDGRWSVNPESLEVEVAVYGVGHSVKLWFVGKLTEDGALVEGFVGDGAIDPAWIGKFTLTKFMPAFESALSPEKKTSASKSVKAPEQRYTVEDMVGPWRVKTMPHKDQPKDELGRSDNPDDYDRVTGRRKKPKKKKQVKGAMGKSLRDSEGKRIRREDVVGATEDEVVAPSFFDVELKPDLTWRSTAGFGEGHIGGRWNVFDDEIKVHSGIKGSGNRVWLECRRFNLLGGSNCVGVSLSDDIMYMGKVKFAMEAVDQSAATEDKEVLKVATSLRVAGYTAVGYQNEPFFTGRFEMSRPPDSSFAVE